MRNDINVFAEEYAKHKSTITKGVKIGAGK